MISWDHVPAPTTSSNKQDSLYCKVKRSKKKPFKYKNKSTWNSTKNAIILKRNQK